MISVWGIGLISVIIAVGRRKSEMKKQLEQPSETNFTQADKLLWVKILAVVVSVGFFSYFLHYILLIFPVVFSFVFVAIMVIIISLSVKRPLGIFGVKPIHLNLLAILLLLDFGISTALYLTMISNFNLKWLFALLPRSIYIFTFFSFINKKIDDYLTKINQEPVLRTTEDLT
jgi:hypothetical protein